MPDTFKALKLNCSLNNVKAIIVNKALWSKATKLSFHTSKLKNMYLYGLSHSELPIHTRQTITAVTLDSIMEMYSIPKVDLIKIDAEGAEYEVLLGAKKILTKTQHLYVECRKDLEQIVKDYLREHGFICIRWEVPHAVHLLCVNARCKKMQKSA